MWIRLLILLALLAVLGVAFLIYYFRDDWQVKSIRCPNCRHTIFANEEYPPGEFLNPSKKVTTYFCSFCGYKAQQSFSDFDKLKNREE